MLRIVYCLTLASFIVASSGCAQIIRGSSTVVTVQSTPPGALVQSSMGMSCQSPCALSLSRNTSQSLTIQADGYQPVSVTLLSQFNVGWFLIDLILTGPFVLISFAGGLYDLSQNNIFVTLQPMAGRTDLQPKVVRLHCDEKDGQTSCDLDEVDEIPAKYQIKEAAL